MSALIPEALLHHCAVYANHLPGDVTGGGHRQECDHAGNLMGLADAAQRRDALHGGVEAAVSQEGLRERC